MLWNGRESFSVVISIFDNFGEGGFMGGACSFDGAEASFKILIELPVADDIFFTNGAFMLKHNCYYMNK